MKLSLIVFHYYKNFASCSLPSIPRPIPSISEKQKLPQRGNITQIQTIGKLSSSSLSIDIPFSIPASPHSIPSDNKQPTTFGASTSTSLK